MATRLEAMQELARRGKLPADLQPYYDELVNRGLVEGAAAPNAATARPQNSDLEGLPIPGTFDPNPQTEAAAPKPYDETAFAQGTSGVNEGIAMVAGLPVDITQGALRLGAHGLNTLAGTDIQLPVDAVGGSASVKALMGGAIRPESEDNGNQMLRRVGQEVGATLVPALGVVAKAAKPLRALTGQMATATGSGAGAAAAQQITDNPYVEMAAQILAGGSVVGATALGKKAITPFTISPERKAVNNALTREGVELTPGQMTGSDALKYAEGEIGGAKAARLTETQKEQFTQAALSRAGISANRATPEVLDDAFDEIGRRFDDLEQNSFALVDQEFGQDIGAAIRDYEDIVGASSRTPIIDDFVDDLRSLVSPQQTAMPPQTGPNVPRLSGEAHKAWRSRLNRAMRNSKDPELKGLLRNFQEAMDGAMERGMAATNSPNLGDWQLARNDYRNLLVIEQAATGAGAAAADGLISPAQLRQAVVSKHGRRNYARGKGDFAELSRAGVSGMTPLPNSGTASRLAVRGMTSGIPTALGALAGNELGGGLGAVAGMAAGAAAPRALGSVMLSVPMRKYLTNQLLPGPLNAGQMVGAPAIGAAANLANGQQRKNSLADLRLRALN